MRGAILYIWSTFGQMGLSGLALDFACGAALSVFFLALVPLYGRAMGILSEKAVSVIGGRRAGYIGNYLTFPGVVLHELSHALGAKLSGARIDSIRLFEPDGMSLGQVRFTCTGRKKRQTALQLAVSSCAPVMAGAVLVPWFLRMASWGAGSPAVVLLSWHGAFSMLCHMDMSGQDLRNYVKGCFWLWPYLSMVFTVAAYAVGHNAGM